MSVYQTCRDYCCQHCLSDCLVKYDVVVALFEVVQVSVTLDLNSLLEDLHRFMRSFFASYKLDQFVLTEHMSLLIEVYFWKEDWVLLLGWQDQGTTTLLGDMNELSEHTGLLLALSKEIKFRLVF